MNTPITTLSEPKFDKWRETHIDYSQCRTTTMLSVETYLTFEELEALVKEMLDTREADE